ncbi:hypothetical protein DL765_005522 [Monosporascus sp. GIB2]|nr:hypothetical protein DL765_005522 [Monosporascus sp. GIB2]
MESSDTPIVQALERVDAACGKEWLEVYNAVTHLLEAGKADQNVPKAQERLEQAHDALLRRRLFIWEMNGGVPIGPGEPYSKALFAWANNMVSVTEKALEDPGSINLDREFDEIERGYVAL